MISINNLVKCSLEDLNKKIRNGKVEIVEIVTNKFSLQEPDFYVEGKSMSYTPRDDGQGRQMRSIKVAPFIYCKYIQNNKI